MASVAAVTRVLQLSDPHLLADPRGICRGRHPARALEQAWRQALDQLQQPPDLLLLSGDLCEDESWGGYVRLRELLEQQLWPQGVPVALLPGNHDHPALLRAALGRSAVVAPALLPLADWSLLLLNSHRPGAVEGWLEARQLAWLDQQLASGSGPLLVALHHPPVAIGDAELDRIALRQGEALLARLLAEPRVRAVVFGHIHQHWQATLPRPGAAPALQLWGCPSTLASFRAVQPCPLGLADWPGGRLLELEPNGSIETQLLRWPPVPGPSSSPRLPSL